MHHPFDNTDGVLGRFGKAEADDSVHSPGVAVVADIMPIDAACLAVLPLVANRALHELIRFQILQGCFANQTFLRHHIFELFRR